jgi:hypothetical protein
MAFLRFGEILSGGELTPADAKRHVWSNVRRPVNSHAFGRFWRSGLGCGRNQRMAGKNVGASL